MCILIYGKYFEYIPSSFSIIGAPENENNLFVHSTFWSFLKSKLVKTEQFKTNNEREY